MTYKELTEVRRLRRHWKSNATRLITTSVNSINIPPSYSGVIRHSHYDSKVERDAINLVDLEMEDRRLKMLLREACERLVSKINEEVENPFDRLILIFRYVDCRSFMDMARLMHYPVGEVADLHYNLIAEMFDGEENFE